MKIYKYIHSTLRTYIYISKFSQFRLKIYIFTVCYKKIKYIINLNLQIEKIYKTYSLQYSMYRKSFNPS